MEQVRLKGYVSKEQFRKQAHIGKATALRMIREGGIPAIDTGKRTNRYLILQSDVDAYIQKCKSSLENHQIKCGKLIRDLPDKYKAKAAKKLQQLVAAHWSDVPDLLWVSDVEGLLGYQVKAIRLWCKQSGLKHFVIENKIRIPKKSLVEFVGSKQFHELPLKSDIHLNLLRGITHE